MFQIDLQMIQYFSLTKSDVSEIFDTDLAWV